MQKIEVSVIIPLYNVDCYISQCIESILNQSFINFEVIVVNDGSTDLSVKIVEEYVQKDTRVRLISQKNAGVSTARNSGLKVAVGDYIVFVDADDYLAPDYLEYMLGLCKKTDSDFCLSKNAFTQIGEKQIASDNIQVIDSEHAVALLLSPRIIVGCWNKLFRHSFLLQNNLTFSTTLFYGEGLDFITRAADKAKNICVGERKVYYYRRSNEASATSTFSIQKLRNGSHALDLIQNHLESKSRLIDEMFLLHKGLFSLGAITKIIIKKKKKEFFEEYKKWKKALNISARKLTFSRNVSFYRKCMLWGGVIFPSLMAYLDDKRRKRIAKNSY